jgi:hypothetical protein
LKPYCLPDHAPILIAENEPFIAFDLAATVQDAYPSGVGRLDGRGSAVMLCA